MMVSESLTQRIRDVLPSEIGLTEKRMFGGVAFLLFGNMLVGVWKNSLIARVGPQAYEISLQKEYVREFDITGRPMKGWVVVEPEGIESDRQLRDWIARAREFVEQLPRK